MKYNQYKIKARVWLYPGMTGWHFVTIPKNISDEIKQLFKDRTRGWGSLRVQVNLGETSWQTSIFPDKKEDAYLLPLKSEIRKKENITENDLINFILEVL
jgi:hypothetical protein